MVELGECADWTVYATVTRRLNLQFAIFAIHITMGSDVTCEDVA